MLTLAACGKKENFLPSVPYSAVSVSGSGEFPITVPCLEDGFEPGVVCKIRGGHYLGIWEMSAKEFENFFHCLIADFTEPEVRENTYNYNGNEIFYYRREGLTLAMNFKDGLLRMADAGFPVEGSLDASEDKSARLYFPKKMKGIKEVHRFSSFACGLNLDGLIPDGFIYSKQLSNCSTDTIFKGVFIPDVPLEVLSKQEPDFSFLPNNSDSWIYSSLGRTKSGKDLFHRDSLFHTWRFSVKLTNGAKGIIIPAKESGNIQGTAAKKINKEAITETGIPPEIWQGITGADIPFETPLGPKKIKSFYWGDFQGNVLVSERKNEFQSFMMVDLNVKNFGKFSNAWSSNKEVPLYLSYGKAKNGKRVFISLFERKNEGFNIEIKLLNRTSEKDATSSQFTEYLGEKPLGDLVFFENGLKAVRQDSGFVLHIYDDVMTGASVRKALDSRVISDYFVLGEGLKTLVFCTANKLYRTDFEGNDLPGFPKPHFAGGIKGGINLEYFESDGSVWGLISTGTGKIHAYDMTRSGIPVAGWNPLPYPFYSPTGTPVVMHGSNFDLFFINDSLGNVYAFDKMGFENFPALGLGSDYAGAEISVDNSVSGKERAVLYDGKGRVRVINSQGQNFGLPLGDINKKGEFVLADFLGDSRKDYLLLQGNKMYLWYYEGNNFKKAFEKTFDVSFVGLRHFELAGGKSIFGCHSKDGKRIFLFNNKGVILEGFPLPGSVGFDVAETGNQQLKILTADSENLYQFIIPYSNTK